MQQADVAPRSRGFELRLLPLVLFWGVALGLLLVWNLSGTAPGLHSYWPYGLSGGLAAIAAAWFAGKLLFRPSQTPFAWCGTRILVGIFAAASTLAVGVLTLGEG